MTSRHLRWAKKKTIDMTNREAPFRTSHVMTCHRSRFEELGLFQVIVAFF